MTAAAGGAVVGQWLANAGQLALLWLAIPFAILLVGIPIVLVVRVVAELAAMLFGG